MAIEKMYLVDLPAKCSFRIDKIKAFEVDVSASGALIFKNEDEEVVRIYANSEWETVRLSEE
jgi:hypothetical protein